MSAFVILTEPFAEMAKTVMTYYETDRELPAVLIEHPTQNLEPEQLPSRSMQIADAAERLLEGLEP